MTRPLSDDAELNRRVEELSRSSTRRLVAYVAALLERSCEGLAPQPSTIDTPRPAGEARGGGTHADRIMRSAAELCLVQGHDIFSRDQIRKQIGLTRAEWMSGYTAIFQGMRDDHPGGAPAVPRRLRGVFHQVSHGAYELTDQGREIAGEVLNRASGGEE